MNFWKKLMNKIAPDPMDAEIRRLDAIAAISPEAEKAAYWKTLHPLVQAMWKYLVDCGQSTELPIEPSDASSVFYRWGYPSHLGTLGISPLQEELMQKYDHCKEELWQQYKAAEAHFRQLEDESNRKREQAWQRYWKHYQTLPAQLQSLVAWELAKRGASWGRSGFHGDIFQPDIPFPFSMCGWATYQDPRWHHGDAWGVAFRINKNCFGGRKPLLYYMDDDNWPEVLMDELLILQNSSGITGVRTEQRRCPGLWSKEEKEHRVVLFELDPTAIQETVGLGGSQVPTREVGEYIFVLPRAGEFNCRLGEIRDGEMIPLHNDDFCMK